MPVKSSEWFRISVVGKKTDHNLAGDLVVLIQNLMRGLNIHDHEVTFDVWGDEPGGATKRRLDPPPAPR